MHRHPRLLTVSGKGNMTACDCVKDNNVSDVLFSLVNQHLCVFKPNKKKEKKRQNSNVLNLKIKKKQPE